MADDYDYGYDSDERYRYRSDSDAEANEEAYMNFMAGPSEESSLQAEARRRVTRRRQLQVSGTDADAVDPRAGSSYSTEAPGSSGVPGGADGPGNGDSATLGTTRMAGESSPSGEAADTDEEDSLMSEISNSTPGPSAALSPPDSPPGDILAGDIRSVYYGGVAFGSSDDEDYVDHDEIFLDTDVEFDTYEYGEGDEDDEDAFASDDSTSDVLYTVTRIMNGEHALRNKVSDFYDIPTEAQPRGIALAQSGDFGPYRGPHARRARVDVRDPLARPSAGVPNRAGTELAEFSSRVYTGQYAADGSRFYSACQDFCVYVFDTTRAPRRGAVAGSSVRRGSHMHTSLHVAHVARAEERDMSWTITDADVSRDGRWLAYSTINPNVHLTDLTGAQPQQILDLDPADHRGGYSSTGVWSLRFSHDASELVAGSRDGDIFVYDIGAERTTLRVPAHSDDVNAVCFADDASRNVLVSGADDTLIKVWDRRSLQDGRPSGILLGHTEGITYVASKGDGRYCLSNGKDQAMRLWDLRMMRSDDYVDSLRLDVHDFYRIKRWDYRQNSYRRPVVTQHPNDASLMTYRGHSVLRTLIRCHFSPSFTTSQQYVYTGSANGSVHIWHIDGTPVQEIDRTKSQRLYSNFGYNNPNDYDPSVYSSVPNRGNPWTIRDVSWHPFEPNIISTSFDMGNRFEGSLAYHPWMPDKPYTLNQPVPS